MSVFKELAAQRMVKKTKFMGKDVEISKLSVAQVMEIQEEAKAVEEDESKGFDILRKVICLSCPEAAELTSDEFEQFPMEELSTLSDSIMQYSGMGKDKGK